MRILHVANFSYVTAKRKRADNNVRYYAMDCKIHSGLVRNGHLAGEFSYRDVSRFFAPLGLGKKLGAKTMNRHIIETARDFGPDLLLLGHAEIVRPNTIAAIRDMLPNCRVAQWWVDPFSDYAVSHLSAKMPHLDAFFATTAPSYVRQRLTADVMPPVYYLPNIAESTTEDQRAFAAETHEYDLLFMGADVANRAPLLERLEKIPDLRRCFFGFGGRRKIGGRPFVLMFGKSKMGLNLSRASDIPLYSSDRIAQITGNGCLALTPRTPQMDLLFTDQEVAYYDGEDNLMAQIDKYRQNDSDWRKIAEAGWRRAHASYNERRVTRFMTEAAMGADFTEQYEWLAAE